MHVNNNYVYFRTFLCHPSLEKCTCSADANAIVSLRDPHTGTYIACGMFILFMLLGEGRKYLLTHNEQNQNITAICEILQFSEKPHSWFVGETVQKGIYTLYNSPYTNVPQ